MTRSITQTVFNRSGNILLEPSLFFWWNRFLSTPSLEEKWIVYLGNGCMSHLKLNVKDQLMDIHFLSRRALVRGLVSETSRSSQKSNLGEVKNFISHEVIIHSKGPVWEDPSYKAIRYSSGDTDYNMQDHTSNDGYIGHNIFKKNVANLRDNIEWIKINSKGKDYIFNLFSNSPKLYKEFIEVLDQYQA